MTVFRRRPLAALALGLGFAALTTASLASDRAHPAVVELFQSQGCSSCPPANANLMALSARPDVLTLSFQVTYWDQLGWKDTFAQPRFTSRQWDYARAWRRASVFTPQVVVNGRIDTVGVKPGSIEQAIARGDRGASGPAVSLSGGRASVGAGRGPATVWLVRYDPRVVRVPIGRGENGGRTLPHKNVVRQLAVLGVWTGQPRAWPLPASPPGLATAILLQSGPGGPIIAAARA